MQNVNVNVNDREIPPGKVLLAECGDRLDGPRARAELVDQKPDGLRLEAYVGGWALAGSCMRWDNGCWRVAKTINGSQHSRAFKTYDEARAVFNTGKLWGRP